METNHSASARMLRRAKLFLSLSFARNSNAGLILNHIGLK
jgi:hypothetical protein